MIVLDFERPIFELETKIRELKGLSASDLNIANEVGKLEKKLEKLMNSIYSNLKPWQVIQVSRHPERPQTMDYVDNFITDFVPLAGDRKFAEDRAIVAGLGKFHDMPIAVLGHQKGKDTESRVKHNFGMPHPEGYRKACRIMDLANKFNLPLITFVDTAGAYPGVGAEERGQGEAIGRSLEKLLELEVPVITAIIGEGGSGGAVALGVANKILMLEYSIYSVISPEGCASILWRSAEKSNEAAEALRLTARDLKKYGLVDEVVEEPLGGAHRDCQAMYKNLEDAISKALNELSTITNLSSHRNEKFLHFGSL